MKLTIFTLLLTMMGSLSFAQFKTVTFETGDRHKVTADMYAGPAGSPGIVVAHQAKYSRGEYRKTAPKLVEMGYTVLAVDLRSGDKVNGVANATYQEAKRKRMPTTYIYTEPDLVAAIDYLFEKTGQPVIVIGSSYSASLALLQARKNPKVSKAAAFSPGEYLKDVVVADELKGLNKPTFVTSTKAEAGDVKQLMKGVESNYVVQFTPSDAGKHGSKALWSDYGGNAAYWEALTGFLKQ